MKAWCSGLLLIATLALSQTTPTTPSAVPRTILVLYDGTFGNETKFLPVHELVEMPLNHLGLTVDYWDIRNGMPPAERMKDVRGIMTWSRTDSSADPLAFLRWCIAAVDSGKKFVVIGDLPVSRDFKNRLTPLAEINRLWTKIGLHSTDNWMGITYNWKVVYKDSSMIEFERALPNTLPTFIGMHTLDSSVKSFLRVRAGNDPGSDTDLVVISKNGGYIAGNYVHYSRGETHDRLWYLNPFEYFRQVYATDDLPKPDTTTLVGRRIFYSHIDGDGWRNATEVMPYRKDRRLSPYVIEKEIVEGFPDLPVTIAPIVADIDPAWHGTKETMELALELFAHRNVEPASHTYAHPLEWQAFGPQQQAPAREAQGRQKPTLVGRLFNLGREPAPDKNSKLGADSEYQQPISYLDKPFDLNREIQGSIDFLNRILPAGKKVKLLQWSGNAIPFEAAIAATRKAGVRNINGGDTRMDPEYPSYGWVSPVGLQAGNQRQIYASGSNENTYTHLWTDRFFGFRFLPQTLKNTDTPLRLKPLNIYYHMYSGEKLPSLIAIVDNYKYARAQELVPIETSQFAAIGDGFYSTRLISIGPSTWRIENRDALQTIRFDRATLQAVDFEKSTGVLGQRHFQGSLYVALDPATTQPVIALRQTRTAEEAETSKQPFLVNSRWDILSLQRNGAGFGFDTRGYGPGEVTWHVPSPGRYSIQIRKAKGAAREVFAEADTGLLLKFKLGTDGLDKIHVDVTPVPAAAR